MNRRSPLGPFVRLGGISGSQLPRDGRGATSGSGTISSGQPSDKLPSSAGSEIRAFLESVIVEAVPFIDEAAPKSGSPPAWKKKGTSKQLDVLVELFGLKVSREELNKVKSTPQMRADYKDETWFCRRSLHRNAAEQGTASWDEFVHSFKEQHYQSEDAFTPSVIGAREAISWDTRNIEIEVGDDRWVNTTISVIEMKHKIDMKLLKNRTFPIVQISATLAGAQEFIVVSIPLTDFDKSPYSEYARDKSLVVAAYVSIERIRILPTSGEIEWIMATASDAGGVLPQWLQNLAVPSQISHDVDLFLMWIQSQRRRNEGAK